MTIQLSMAEPIDSGQTVTIPITVTVLNFSDVTNGVVSGIQPVQVNVVGNDTIYSF